ncbi:sigma factor-like helix-turn-helix DNA-binding protein [Streptomyces sp. AK02-01A]|uniref:sigma factor-like helix-turn-helix DNA-binding protein n=1 Tax=Streptomyces sp. AK02-01A TaxID=3028648 RepID=UPI00299FBB48|nr:sigma factor-like helix-turn-helix DNA-binding protein [Streptomyces sp. AK02-01A]MDX3851754.1 sigma factor-like helix-turn-helix DNA-binding protein [Streptomyces sp. AK02-01A]
MRQRQAVTDRRRAQEFEAFVAGAAGRLLHAAALLTGEQREATPRAQRLLTAALARTYADWDRLRAGDPYDSTRQELALRFARGAWLSRRGPSPDGVLAGLAPQERVVLVLRLYEGVAEEQIAALIGVPVERVRAVYARAVATVRDNTAADRSGASEEHRP